MKKLKVSTLAMVGVGALTLAGCSGGADAGSNGEFNVYVAAAISGPDQLAKNAKTSALAVEASAKIANESGGIGGRQIKVTVLDDGGDPTIAVSKLREIASGDTKPDLYVNTGSSTVGTATVPILTQNRILSFTMSPTASGADPKVAPYNFDISPSAEVYAKGIAAFVAGKQYQDVGIIHGNSTYGENFGNAMVAALGSAGVKVTESKEYDTAALDMTAQLQSLKNAGTKALVVDAYGAPLGYLIQSLERLGWDVPLIGNNSVAGTSSIATPPPGGFLGVPQTKDMVMQMFHSTAYDPADELVNTAVDTMAGMGTIASTLIVAASYDAVPMVAAAAESAGGTDLDKLVDAIEDIEVQKQAKTAMIPVPNYSAESHSSNPDASTFTYIAPTPLLNGQFANPAAGGA
ncbi:ABC transporter substrate-binding protein [Rhodococcus kronopolitis]|uniref:ABC transporter substrate-binding protein n=1 Tax=Rhodococcus kronopolitis TaxID=1460226 RepID=A0ABV9FSW0_9NOCA